MIVEKRTEDNSEYPATVLFVEGCVELGKSAKFFSGALENVLRKGNVIVDWSRVDYTESTGIGELVEMCLAQVSGDTRLAFSDADYRVLDFLEDADEKRTVRVFDTLKKAVRHVSEWGIPRVPAHDVRRHRDRGAVRESISSTNVAGVPRAGTSRTNVETSRERRRVRLFLCHASNDKDRVREISRELAKSGADVWFDEDKLLPGEDWKLEIQRALRSVDAAVVCLSAASVSKTGFVQREVAYALEIAQEHPEGSIFLIPVKLEPCAVPERLQQYHWADLSVAGGFRKLIKSLNKTASRVGANVLSG
jgi:anti-anti-sigma regulatory factor